jgi:pimeloyl-ACP methyl ester carboxylesterase
MYSPQNRRPAAVAMAGLLVACTRLLGVELEPIAQGPFAVASTHLAVTPRSDVPMFDFLNGKRARKEATYLTSILTHPEAVPTLSVNVPDDAVFGAHAHTTMPLVLVIFYPTSSDNPRPDYAFPYKETGDALIPHMQRPGEKPILADPAAKYPVIVLSGGYNTHALWHLEHLKLLASHGYIVADMFHGDGRGAAFHANMALRSLHMRATIDFLLEHSDFANAIDAERIGAVGHSAGGHTVLAALGGIDPSGKFPAAADPRIKAGFTLGPSTGGGFAMGPFKLGFWPFGTNRAGLRQVRAPFFAVYGEKDRSVLPDGVETAVRQIAGPATALMLDGETHSFSNATISDYSTWQILFFDAWLRNNATARRQLETGTSVRGGVNDHKTIEHGAVSVP